MTTTIFKINVKPDTPGEVGLPKIPVEKVMISKWGLDGDYNRFRKQKKKYPRVRPFDASCRPRPSLIEHSDIP